MEDYSFESVSNFEALYKAYRKSRKGSGHKKSKYKFAQTALYGVSMLKYQLNSKKYFIDRYNKFKVYEPKEREIAAGSFKDKIVQHSLCDNYLLPYLSHHFIENNFAGQIGKGTHFGLKVLEQHMLSAYSEYGMNCWIVKCDVRKYFYNIDHDILKDIIEFHFSDSDILWLCKKYIDSAESPGLPLGNQVSQVFALLYLSGLDQFITGELCAKYYGRYMDDFYIIVRSKTHAKDFLEYINTFVQSLNIELNEKSQIIPFKNGIRFCGFHTYITSSGIPIRKLTNEKKRKGKKKYIKMAKLVNEGKISKKDFETSYSSFRNHLSFGNCVKFSYKLDKEISEVLDKEGTE